MPAFVKTGPIWGLLGFILGAVVSGALVNSGALFAPASKLQSDDAHDAHEALAKAHSSLVAPQRILLSAVKDSEIDEAIRTLPLKKQRSVREDLQRRAYRLLWLTTWDWDTSDESGNSIVVSSGDYHGLITLRNRRTRVAIPEPPSGYIEMRGEQTEDGNIAISLLSGTVPIALPRMPPGQTIKIEIEAPRKM